MKLNDIGKIIGEYWRKLPQKFNNVSLDEYVIMPNHLHGIIVITTPVGAGFSRPMSAGFSRPQTSLGQIIAWFKYQSTKQINQIIYDLMGITNNGREDRAPTNKKYQKIWQRNFYEHIIRNEEELGKIQQYILTNPQRWEKDKNYPYVD